MVPVIILKCTNKVVQGTKKKDFIFRETSYYRTMLLNVYQYNENRSASLRLIKVLNIRQR